VTKWVSGTTYTEGSVVWSPVSYLSYRRKTTGGGTTDPSLDGTNWAQSAGTGNVSTDGSQTLTNKTINGSNNTITNVSLSTGVTGTLPAANGGTGITSPGTSGNLLTSDGTAWTSAAPAPILVNYAQNIQSADYTLVIGDAGKQIFHPASDANFRTFTIPSNASVAFPIGTTVLFVVENGGTGIKVSINSDTLVTVDGVTGTKRVAASDVLTAIKVTTTKWVCWLANDSTVFFDQQIAIAHSTTPFISAYSFSDSGFGTKYANPATLPTGGGSGVAFSPDGSAIAVAHATTPFVTAYPWSGSGFGTKYANPATLPTGDGSGVAFSPSGLAIAVSHATTPCISAYPWSGSGFGT
jgi:hypothetical protein